MLELYHNDMSTCAQKVRLTLAHKGLDWEGHHMDLRRGDTRTEEYKKLNPNGVVPTLIDDGWVLIESTVIMSYLDDAYPDHPLRPSDARGRARVVLWTKKLDEGLHADTSTISGSIAFRYQMMEGRSDEEVEEFIDKIPDPVRRERQRKVIREGVESEFFKPAIRRFDQLFSAMENALMEQEWLAGDVYSLADIAYTPYLTRFEHLNLLGILDHRPCLANWYDRVKSLDNYQGGIADWLNPKYIPLMAEKGAEVWPRVQEIIAGD